MLSNSLINATNYNMNQGNPLIEPKTRFSRNSLILSRDSNCKSKLPSSLSCISDVTNGVPQSLKTNLSEDSNIIPNYCKSSMRINKATTNANVSTRKLWSNSSKLSRNSIYTSTNCVIEEESELIDMLTKQLYMAESQMRKMRSVLTKAEEGLRTKDQEIGRLKRKVKDWETKHKNQEVLRKKERQKQAEKSEHLYQQCLTLERRIFEMEKFLADYGLVWVGDTKDAVNTDDASNNYIDACYEQLVANIDQLNLTAGKGEIYVHRNEKGGGATFKTPSCMVLKFYKNGMIVQRGPLRSYNDPNTRSFIRDILDGYFPSELQQEYPDGVPFTIEDRRAGLYINDATAFPGQGYRLGRQSPVDNVLSTNMRKSSNVCQRSRRINPSPKDNACNSENVPFLSLPTSRSLKLKLSSEIPPVDLLTLRTQILASHNNICSNSHLQSHVNAELARSSRREKREQSAKNSECDTSIKEHLSKSKDSTRTLNSCSTKYHSSTSRSSFHGFSPSRVGIVENCLRPRLRSTSLSAGRLAISMQSVSRPEASSTAKINDIGNLKISKLIRKCSTRKLPRSSKSATCTKKNTSPILHQVNESTGKPDELRLKVRSFTGNVVYLVHVSADESISKLYELLDKPMQTFGYRGYKVVLNGYSSKRLERVNTSLKENGIFRDCVLHLVNG